MKKLNKSDVNVNDWEFEFQQRNEHRILFADLWSRALYYEHESEMKLSIGQQDSLFLSDNTGYAKKEQRQKIFQLLKKSVEKDDRYLEYVFETTQKRVNELKQLADKIINKVNNDTRISNEELAKLWKEFDDLIIKVIPWFYIPWYITENNILSDRVKNELEKHKKEIEKITDINYALFVLISPIKRMMFQDEQKDFYDLVKYANNKKEFERDSVFLKKADKYLENYAWMKTFAFLPIEPLTIEELIERIKDAMKNKMLDNYQMQEKEIEKNLEIANKLRNLLNEDKNLIRNIDWTKDYGWLLTYSVEVALKAAGQLQTFYKLIAKVLKIDFNDFSHLTSEEILEGLKNSFTVSKNELAKRREGYAFLFQNNEAKLITGKEALEIIKWIRKEIVEIKEEVTEFKGQSASPGIVKGKVKIAPTPKDSYKIEEGEILVCSMTSPDYVPAMKKAGAVVTDEGGLLSHAAIVSRELRKPCIVGTKIASRILKTGDLIEVDADNGIVRIIHKNS